MAEDANVQHAQAEQGLRKLVPKDWPTFAIFLGIVGSVVTFFYHWSSDLDTRIRESRKPFLELQLATYAKITPITAKITRLWSSRNDEAQKAAYRTAVDEFWDLYWGV